MPNISIVHSGSANKHGDHITAFQNGVAWATNAAIIYRIRFADDGDPTVLSNLFTDEILHHNPTLLVAAGGTTCAKAAVQPTSVNHMPVVFTSIADPVRPANNMTGVCARTTLLDIDRLNYLSRALTGRTNFGVLFNLARDIWAGLNPPQLQLLQNEAATLSVNLFPTGIDPTAGNVEAQIRTAFVNWRTAGIQGALVAADPLFNNHRGTANGLIAAANNNGIPTIYQWREFAAEHGFMSYGPKLAAAYTLAGIYAGRILNDPTKVSLPVLSMNDFELVVNLVTANTFPGVVVPDLVLAEADDIIVQ
jgi:putative tryptophan/tyrosine transport system substrate-binding protein